MESLAAYIPMDRRQALARGEDLPDRAGGTALSADISGFTPLAEALLHELGARCGAEELTRQLNLLFDALVVEARLRLASTLRDSLFCPRGSLSNSPPSQDSLQHCRPADFL